MDLGAMNAISGLQLLWSGSSLLNGANRRCFSLPVVIPQLCFPSDGLTFEAGDPLWRQKAIL